MINNQPHIPQSEATRLQAIQPPVMVNRLPRSTLLDCLLCVPRCPAPS